MGDQKDRRQKLTADIRQRLKDICSNLGEPDFEDLVGKIADNYARADERAVRAVSSGRHGSTHDRPPTK